MNNSTIKRFDITIKLRGDNIYDLYFNDTWVASRGSYENILDETKKLNGIVGEFVCKPITVDYLQKILNDYFDIPNDTYAYNLTRDKQAFMCGTMGFDDFEEFDEDTTRDLAEYIIKCFNT